MLQGRIKDLKKRLIEFATLVESMISKSIKGLVQKDKGVLLKVIEEDEPKTNNLEMEIDTLCANLIAQFQPAAKDLRTILMILKMNNDLERMGDHAVNMCQSTLYLIERPQLKALVDLPRMAEETAGMLKDSINSFINEDAKLAKSVCERDSVVDGLRDGIWRDLIAIMTSNKEAIERALNLMRFSRNLERISDLATNICEDVIFMVEGRVIKHHKDEKQEHQAPEHQNT